MNNYLDFAIYYVLCDGKCHSAFSLAEKFEVCKKTIYRHVSNLVYAGLPITTMPGKNGGIILKNKPTFNLNYLNNAEAYYLKELIVKNENNNLLSQIIIGKLNKVLNEQ